MTTLGTVIGRGVLASRPAAGTAGALYYATDTLVMYRDNGSSWDVVAASNPMTTAGDIIIGGSSGLPTRLAAGSTSGHVLTSNGSGVAPSWQAAAGGGGGAPTTAKYVTSASDGTLSAEIVIPGLAGSADIAAGGGSDDEFDTTDTSDPMTGWTTIGSPSTHDINSTALSHYYVKAPASDNNLHGIYKACPSIPFTMTAKLTDAALAANFNYAGIAIAEGTPGKYELLGIAHATTTFSNVGRGLNHEAWTNRTTYGSTVATKQGFDAPIYLRIVVTSSSNVTFQYSMNGKLWRTLTSARNPGFTVGSVALFVSSQNASQAEAIFDWVRFT